MSSSVFFKILLTLKVVKFVKVCRPAKSRNLKHSVLFAPYGRCHSRCSRIPCPADPGHHFACFTQAAPRTRPLAPTHTAAQPPDTVTAPCHSIMHINVPPIIIITVQLEREDDVPVSVGHRQGEQGEDAGLGRERGEPSGWSLPA